MSCSMTVYDVNRGVIARPLNPLDREFLRTWCHWKVAKIALGLANKRGMKSLAMRELNRCAAEMRSAHRDLVSWRIRAS